MINLLNLFLQQASNLWVGFTFALVSSAFGILVAYLGHQRYPNGFSPESSKIAENVHNSLLGFLFLLAALSIGESRQNLNIAEAAVSQVAFKLQQFDRDLVLHEMESRHPIRRAIADYALTLIAVDWPKFKSKEENASAATMDPFEKMAFQIENISRQTPQRELILQIFRKDLAELEKAHGELIVTTSKHVPDIFWHAIAMLLVFSTFCNIRYQRSAMNYVLIGGHMAVIGAAIALLAMLDAPFRGETSVKPVAIERLCAQLITPCRLQGQ